MSKKSKSKKDRQDRTPAPTNVGSLTSLDDFINWVSDETLPDPVQQEAITPADPLRDIQNELKPRIIGRRLNPLPEQGLKTTIHEFRNQRRKTPKQQKDDNRRRNVICEARELRRRVMFAIRGAGKGSSFKRPKFTKKSKRRC